MLKHITLNPLAALNTVLLAICTVLISMTYNTIEKSHARDLENIKIISDVKDNDERQDKELEYIRDKFATREWIYQNFETKKNKK